MTDRVALVTADDETLEAELAPAAAPRAQVVLCHPHPQFGGDMRSLVETYNEPPRCPSAREIILFGD